MSIARTKKMKVDETPMEKHTAKDKKSKHVLRKNVSIKTSKNLNKEKKKIDFQKH